MENIMAKGILSFADFLGGPDSLFIEQIFPTTQRTLEYNFGQNITGWTFSADYQTLIVDKIAFDRNGDPNFSTSTVIGFFAKADITATNISVVGTSTGRVNVVVPANMYTGPIYADARKNVPITVVGVTWTDSASPANINTHRWGFIQCYEPGVSPTDPTTATGYVSIT